MAYLFPQNYTGTFTSYLQTYHNVVSEVAYLTRSTTQNKIKPIPARTKVSENLFFPYCIKEWSKLDEKIRSIKSISKFKVTILNIIRLKGNSIFGIHDTNGIKLLSRLRLSFSHLIDHKFWYNFNETVDTKCTCGLELETKHNYFLRCSFSSTHQRLELLNDECICNPSLKNYSNEKLQNSPLYGSEDFNCNINKEILKATIKFLKIPEHFNSPLFYHA